MNFERFIQGVLFYIPVYVKLWESSGRAGGLPLVIKHIKKIVNYKSFRLFQADKILKNDELHNNINILYGENGTGKSSICNILKSVAGQKDFGKYKPSEIKLVFDIGDKEYTASNGWNTSFDENSILFFDRQFINKNVHLGHDRDRKQGGHEQESGKLIIEFDQEAIRRRKERTNAKEEKELQDAKSKEFYEVNKDFLSFELSDKEKELFELWKNTTEDEVKEATKFQKDAIEKLKETLKTNEKHQKNVLEIQQIETIQMLYVKRDIPQYEVFQSLFDFDLKIQSQIQAEKSLIDKVRTYKQFFESGIQIRNSFPNQCPFCESKSEEDNIVRIIQLYHDIFDTSYKSQLHTFQSQQKELIGELEFMQQQIKESDLSELFLKLKTLDQKYQIENIYRVEEEKEFSKPLFEKTEILKEKLKLLEKQNKQNKENIKKLYDLVSQEAQQNIKTL